MSSTTITPALNDVPTFTPTGDGGGDNTSVNRGANYFFGFLITFIALLLIFVGCGLISRRRLAIRRQVALLETWGIEGSDGMVKVPTLLEKPIVKGQPGWVSITPLTAKLLRESQLHLRDDDTAPNVEHPSPQPHRPERLSPLNLPSWIHEESKKLPFRHRDKNAQVEALEVAVMITMPSEPQSLHAFDNDDSQFPIPEYQVGVSTLPWHVELHPSHE